MPASDDAIKTVATSVKGNLDFERLSIRRISINPRGRAVVPVKETYVVNINVRPKNPKRDKKAIDGRADTGIRGWNEGNELWRD